SLQGKISSDGCLKKEQMVVSAIASTPQLDLQLQEMARSSKVVTSRTLLYTTIPSHSDLEK
ncbi:hypothetical protein, partial [Escherichia coli]|uniref:hypothetical protein n=1 Tax=Escherichia coli TaxID=562 RepID=UPI001BC8AB95